MNDVLDLEIGMMLDILTTFVNQYDEMQEQKENRVREATQSDFDRF